MRRFTLLAAISLVAGAGEILLFAQQTPLSGGSPTPSVTAADATTAGLPATLTILGQELALKDAKRTPVGSFIAEYIPANSTWDNYTLLFAIRFKPDAFPTAVMSAQQTGKNILALRTTHPLDNAMMMKSKDGHGALVDFLVSSDDLNLDKHVGFLEHNFWRYIDRPGGVMSYQIARRFYASGTTAEQAAAFIKGIATLRGTLITQITDEKLPVPTIAIEAASSAPSGSH